MRTRAIDGLRQPSSANADGLGRVIGIALLAVLAPVLCHAGGFTPTEALDRYLEGQGKSDPSCSDQTFAVQIDASLPMLKKHGTVTGFERILEGGRAVYHGLRFTGDNIIKTQVMARFLARQAKSTKAEGAAITRANYTIVFDKEADYNGLAAYVFLLKPRRKRTGVFRGELWLKADTATPLRLWGDVMKSPSVLVRSFRFVQDYQMVCGCTEPLRLLLSARTLEAGRVEMSVWLHPTSEQAETEGSTCTTLNGDESRE